GWSISCEPWLAAGWTPAPVIREAIWCGDGPSAGTRAQAGTGRASHWEGSSPESSRRDKRRRVRPGCPQSEEGAVVQHLTDHQPALLTATDSTQPGLPRVGHVLATFSRRYPVGVGAALVLCMIALLAVLAPMVAPYDPNFQHFNDLQQPPSAKYWLGTDYEGRDVLSRLIYGGRVSLTVAVLSVLLGTV